MDDMSKIERNVVAQDRLNTLASIMFDNADLDYEGNDLNLERYAKVLLKAWFPETYNATLESLKEKERQEKEERKRRLEAVENE
jgi:hypothetical protein